MARPTKNNAEYFSHDADMRNDVKVKALRRNFSHKGYAVWCFILETLTDTDFFELDFDEVNKELLAADFDITVDELDEIVNYCLKINLLQMTDENRLFSAAHQRRFSGLITKRERDRERISRLMAKKNGSEKDVITAENGKSGCYRGDNTDSKVKESKIEESKEKTPNGVKKKVAAATAAPVAPTPESKAKRFTRPSVEEVRAYCAERGNAVNAEAFVDFYESKGWKVGNSPMKDWRAAVRTWEKRDGRGARKTADGAAVNLGEGEWIDSLGTRRYGTGKPVPMSAPPRPGADYYWSKESNSWIAGV